MTTDFGFVNVKEHLFAPLPLSLRQQNVLTTTINKIMSAYGAKPAELLSLYSEAPVMWEIPCLYSEDLMTAGLNVALTDKAIRSPTLTYQCYRDLLTIVDKQGFGDQAVAVFSDSFGSVPPHPMIFTRTDKGGPESRALFGLEWACLLSLGAKQAVFQDNHAFVRISNNFFVPPMGVIHGTCGGGSDKVSREWLEEAMYRPRGFIEFDTFDALDRANLWVMRNFATLTEPEKILRGLCLLKLSCNHKAAYKFEQGLRHLAPPVILEPTLKSLLYTDDALATIRDIWVDQTKNQVEKFELLHTQLVPMYLDSQQFKNIFRVKKAPSSRFSLTLENEVVRGIEEFIALFLQTRRAIAEGKRVVMEE